MNSMLLYFILFFLVIPVLLYRTKKIKKQQIILLVASYLFYSLWDWRFMSLLVVMAIVIWQTAKYVQQSRTCLAFGVGGPLLTLGVCKYWGFFADTYVNFFGGNIDLSTLNVILPLGISFYTFMAISYVLDVYHGKIAAESRFIPVALYISFFPTVVSGPITKARDIIGQFNEVKRFSWENMQVGWQIFIMGCLKKFLLADYLAVFVEDVYHAPLAFDSATVWLAVLSYSLQLYLDFSGYSDMAIGCGRVMGFRLAENFNLPYIAKNVGEFWKRWHISLSSWLQEYLYFSLGGNRCSNINVYRNLILTMLVCGLWHGSSLNYLLWGVIHGIFLCVHRVYKNGIAKRIHTPVIIKILVTFLLVSLIWVFLRGTDIQNTGDIFYRLFFWESAGISQMYVYSWIAIVLVLAVSVYSYRWNNGQGLVLHMDISKPVYFFLFWLEIFILLDFMYVGSHPFIYAAY